MKYFLSETISPQESLSSQLLLRAGVDFSNCPAGSKVFQDRSSCFLTCLHWEWDSRDSRRGMYSCPEQFFMVPMQSACIPHSITQLNSLSFLAFFCELSLGLKNQMPAEFYGFASILFFKFGERRVWSISSVVPGAGVGGRRAGTSSPDVPGALPALPSPPQSMTAPKRKSFSAETWKHLPSVCVLHNTQLPQRCWAMAKQIPAITKLPQFFLINKIEKECIMNLKVRVKCQTRISRDIYWSKLYFLNLWSERKGN